MLDELITFFVKMELPKDHDFRIYASWLKALKDRVGCEANCTTTKEWKPSDEQMDALLYISRYYAPTETDKLGWESLQTLELMLSQLKKLKGE